MGEPATLAEAYELLFVASHRPNTREGRTLMALAEALFDVRRVWLVAEAHAADPSRLVDGLRISASYTLNCVVIPSLQNERARADGRARPQLDRLLKEARTLSVAWGEVGIELARHPEFLRGLVAAAEGIGIDDVPPLSPGGNA